MQSTLIDELSIALAQNQLHFHERHQACIDWAQHALAAGYDSHSLRILAGLDEVDEACLNNALQELGVDKPAEEACFNALVASIIQSCLTKQMSLRKGCRQLYRICIAADNAGLLEAFVGLDDAWELSDDGTFNVEDVEKQTLSAMLDTRAQVSPER